MGADKLGVNTFYPCVETLLQKLEDLGYSHVYFSSRIFAQSDKEMERIASLCKQHGILPCGAHSPDKFLPQEEKDLDRTIELHKKVLDQALILGCDSVNFHVASVNEIPNEDTGRFIEKIGAQKFDEMNFAVLSELARHAGKNKMMVAVENLPRDIVANYCRNMSDLRRIIGGADEANVGICIDTGHAHISGLKSSDMILEAGDKLIQTHINDNFGWLCEENAINDIHSPPGTGTVDWLRVVDALAKIGYERPITFELKFRGQPDNPDELDQFLRLTRDNWRMIVQLWKDVKENLSDPLE